MLLAVAVSLPLDLLASSQLVIPLLLSSCLLPPSNVKAAVGDLR